MKIAYITMQFPVPSETFLSNDVESVTSAGHAVKVYGMRPNHKEHEYMLRERNHCHLEVRNFDFRVLLDAFFVFFLKPYLVVSLILWLVKTCSRSPLHLFKSLLLVPTAIGHYRDIMRSPPDVVHLFWGHYPCMIGYLLKRSQKSLIVTQFLGAHDLMARYPGSLEFSKLSDRIFTHSEANIPLLKEFGISIDKVSVVHRGTRTNFRSSSSEKFYRLSCPIVITASRLIEEKGVDDVIDIFKTLHNSNRDAKLIIAGEGPCEKRLKQKVSDLGLQCNVSFLGHTTHSHLLNEMSYGHFFLLLSKYPAERLPNVVKEAMLQQCVVITTRSTGIEELVDHSENGFIVEVNDVDAVMSYIKICLKQPMLAKAIAKKGSETIVNRFDVDKSMKIYIDIWEELCLLRSRKCDRADDSGE